MWSEWGNPTSSFTLSWKKKTSFGNSLVVQWLKPYTSTAGCIGLIPGGRTKIPYVVQCNQNKTNKTTTTTKTSFSSLSGTIDIMPQGTTSSKLELETGEYLQPLYSWSEAPGIVSLLFRQGGSRKISFHTFW